MIPNILSYLIPWFFTDEIISPTSESNVPQVMNVFAAKRNNTVVITWS